MPFKIMNTSSKFWEELQFKDLQESLMVQSLEVQKDLMSLCCTRHKEVAQTRHA